MSEIGTQLRLEALLRAFSGVGADYAFTEQTRFREDLQLDSLDLIELALKIEDEFHIQLDDEDVDLPVNGTLGGMCNFIDGRAVAA